MAKRKPTRKKRRSPKKRKKTSLKNSLSKAFAGLAILAVLVVAIGFLVYYLAPPEKPSPALSVSKSTRTKEKPLKKPVFEIFSKEKTPAPERLAKVDIPKAIPGSRPLPSGKLPRVALIIDDLGYDKKMAKKFSGLDINLTFSILPHSPFQNKIARLARSKC